MRIKRLKEMFLVGGLLYVLLAVFLFFWLPQAVGSDLNLDVTARINVFQNESLETGVGIEARLAYDPFYLWGSYDETQLRLYGQRAGEISLYGVGLGMKYELTSGLWVWGQGGYYGPASTMEDSPENFTETLGHVFRNHEDTWGAPHLSDRYGYKIGGNLGGAVGLSFDHEVYKGLRVNLNAGYRFLKLRETFYQSYAGYHNFFEFKGDRDFSGGMIGVGIVYRF